MNDMPDPSFERQSIEWAREYPLETTFSVNGDAAVATNEKIVKRVIETYRSYRLCPGGKLRWQKVGERSE